MTATSLLPICGLALMLAAGCGNVVAPVPDVAGQRLDVAEKTLEAAGLDYEVTGGGAFGVVVRSHWQVCFQHPAPGRRAASVELVVARACAQPAAARRVPDVRGLRLDAAERELVARGLEYYLYGDHVIIRTNWIVCGQDPDAGRRAVAVDLYIEHFSCEAGDDD
jgi:beta-lactam-binding protein with PASTA domain